MPIAKQEDVMYECKIVQMCKYVCKDTKKLLFFEYICRFFPLGMFSVFLLKQTLSPGTHWTTVHNKKFNFHRIKSLK